MSVSWQRVSITSININSGVEKIFCVYLYRTILKIASPDIAVNDIYLRIFSLAPARWCKQFSVHDPLWWTGVFSFPSLGTPTHCLLGHAVVASHIKQRKMGTDVSSGPNFLSKKEEDQHRMLPQGLSSSHTKIILSHVMPASSCLTLLASTFKEHVPLRAFKL